MSGVYERGKQQVLYNYLPGRVFDFGNTASFTIVRSVEGERFDGVNANIILNKIREQANAWTEVNRPGLENVVFNDSRAFSVINPKKVKADLYPLVFLCENSSCNHLVDLTNQSAPTDNTCPKCGQKKLVQFRFILAHQCGHIEPLRPPKCERCKTNSDISITGLLQFERFSDFQFRCKKCGNEVRFFSGYCPGCDWKGDQKSKMLQVLLFRANRQYYIHTTTLINIPNNEYDGLLTSNDWHIVVGAKYLDLPAINHLNLKQISAGLNSGPRNVQSVDVNTSIELLRKVKAGELTLEQVEKEMLAQANRPAPALTEYKRQLLDNSGVEEHYWKEMQFSILDSLIPRELSEKCSLRESTEREREIAAINEIGLSDVQLIDDFPIVTTSFGYSRLSYRPEEAWLRPFEGQDENLGKIPIYVDTFEADALFFQLDHDRVLRWLKANSMHPDIPSGADTTISNKSYFIKLFSKVDLYKTIDKANREAKYVLGLMHTFAHLGIRRAELLCGLEQSSMSEYLIPSTLSFAIHCNNRFGSTMGALNSLYEQALLEWVNQILDRAKCVYDPVCQSGLGSCHACTHLPEMSCRHFNLNLGRVYLFGGENPDTNEKIIGYFENY